MANNNLIMDIVLLNSIIVGVGLGSIIGAIIYFAIHPLKLKKIKNDNINRKRNI
jgi:hypothetical protein